MSEVHFYYLDQNGEKKKGVICTQRTDDGISKEDFVKRWCPSIISDITIKYETPYFHGEETTFWIDDNDRLYRRLEAMIIDDAHIPNPDFIHDRTGEFPWNKQSKSEKCDVCLTHCKDLHKEYQSQNPNNFVSMKLCCSCLKEGVKHICGKLLTPELCEEYGIPYETKDND